MFRFVATTAAILLLAAPAVLADGRKPGSVGIFPIHRSGPSSITVISLTNTNVNPVSGETLVHYEYVNVVANPANAFLPLACVVFDRIELLTPTDTFSVLTSCHNPTFGDQAGYLVVSAQDPTMFNMAWSFNYLIGSELVINGSGSAYSLNMLPFTSPLDEGTLTDKPILGGQGQPVGGGDEDGQLDFDGVEYEEIPEQLYIDSFLAVNGSNLVLINLTGGQNAINTVKFFIWNDNEFPLSTTLSFKCWFDQPLSSIDPLFESNYLANNTPDDPNELDISAACDGSTTTETGWAIIDSIDVSEPGGTFISSDGAIVGCIATSPNSIVAGGRLLWESVDTQDNGAFMEP